MPYTSTREMLLKAQRHCYAIAAFNFENMEMAQAIVAAAEALGAPVILQTTPGTVRYASPALLAAMARALAQEAFVPVALHLDHGSSVALAAKALEAGYSSVMIDGSSLPFEQNVDVTRRVLALAGEVPVEAELGAIGGKEDDLVAGGGLTDPADVEAFLAACPVQSLAVAIGSAHGIYRQTPRLDVDRLRAIRAKTDVPLVLHGASGIPEDQVRACIREGICKVNYATELRMAYTQGVLGNLRPEAIDPKVFGKAGREAVQETVAARIRLCGADGKA